MNIIIVEDELVIAHHLKNIIEGFGYSVIGIVNNRKNLFELLKKTVPSLVLMDINLGTKHEGVDITKQLKSKYNFPIIYITAHSDAVTIEKALGSKPEGFIVKPFKKPEIYTAIKIAMAKMEAQNYIFFKDAHTEVKLKNIDIKFIESEKNYLNIHTTNKKYIIRCSLKNFIKKLDQNLFLRIHRSFIVNLQYVSEVNRNFLIIDKQKIPISRSYYQKLKSKFKI